jgi:hypothetical protein
MRKFAMILGMAVSMVSASSVQAALQGYEGFTGYNTGDIVGQVGSGQIGFEAAAWGTNGGSASNKTVTATGLSYTNGGELVTSGGALQSAGGFNRAHRGITTPIDPGVAGGGKLWLSYLFKSGTSIEDANQVRFYTGNDQFDGEVISADVVRTGAGAEGVNAVKPRAWFTDNAAAGGQSQFKAPGETNLILLEYTLDDSAAPGNQGVMRMYVNPAIGGAEPEQSSAAAILSGAGDYSNMTRLSFFSPGGGNFAVTWDEIRFGDSFASVTPVVPEPASLGLLALAGVAALRRRRQA